MGQYHKIVNLDKKQFLHPHKFGDGLKLLEFGASGGGTMCGLAILLAASCKGGGRGGGDCESELSGAWAGDRIAIIGDYAEADDVPGCDASETYNQLGENGTFTDISEAVMAAVTANIGKRQSGGRLAPDMIVTSGRILTGKAAADAMNG